MTGKLLREWREDGWTERPIIVSTPMVRAILAGAKTQTRRVVKPQPVAEDVAEPGDLVFYGGVLCKVRESRGRNEAATGRLNAHPHRSPYGQPGDMLWVRETWGRYEPYPSIGEDYCMPEVAPRGFRQMNYWSKRIVYRAEDGEQPGDGRWRSPIHMPKWASRLRLRVEQVRVERLCDISEEDCIAEGLHSELGDYGRDPAGQRGCRWVGVGYEGATRGNFHTAMPDGHCRCALGGPTPAQCAFRDIWNEINGKRAPWDSDPWVWVIDFSVIPTDDHRALVEAERRDDGL